MFDWDDANEGHIWERHRVTRDEAEEAATDERRFSYPGASAGERRVVVVGSTHAGRILAVVYTIRSGRFRVATARDANRWERERYRRQGRRK